jgi:hypothetical protein
MRKPEFLTKAYPVLNRTPIFNCERRFCLKNCIFDVNFNKSLLAPFLAFEGYGTQKRPIYIPFLTTTHDQITGHRQVH